MCGSFQHRAGIPGTLALAGLLVAAAGCGGESNGKARPIPRAVTWTAPRDPAEAPPARAVEAAPRPAPPRRRVAARPRPRAAAHPPAAPIDPKNRQQPPAADPELTRQARALLQAVIAGEPARAKGFFFPRQHFTPLKKGLDPDRYWRLLHAVYEKDIRRLRRRWADWSGATFESIRLSGPAVWIRPGREHNKIGYFRTYRARLHYRLQGRRYSIFVHTLISWQGHWYVTHLLPYRRRKKKPPRP